MATLDDIDLYGDGLATELNVSQSVSTPVSCHIGIFYSYLSINMMKLIQVRSFWLHFILCLIGRHIFAFDDLLLTKNTPQVVSAPYIKPEPTPQIKLEPTTMVTPTPLPFPPPAAISVKVLGLMFRLLSWIVSQLYGKVITKRVT